MVRVRWTVFCLALLIVGLAALPGIASAAPNDAPSSLAQGGSGSGERNIISVPGVFSLRLGGGASTPEGALRLESTEIDLPGINATAVVDGLTLDLRNGAYGWEAITLRQAGPSASGPVTLSETQATVLGPAANYSVGLTTRVDVQPSETTQAGATLTLLVDRQTGQTSFAVSDGDVQVTAGPATITVEGVDAGDGSLTVDSAQVMLPEAQTGVRVDGFTVADGSASWQALAWYGREFNLGNVLTLSDSLVVVPGPDAAQTGAGGARTTFTINAGDVAQTGGQLVISTDPITGQPAVSVRNGSAVLGVAGWNLAVNGVNTGPNGASIASVTVSAEPLNLQAQVTGIEAEEGSAASFDQARILYLPAASGETRAVAGFELVITSTPAGYVISTTTLVPTAQAGQ